MAPMVASLFLTWDGGRISRLIGFEDRSDANDVAQFPSLLSSVSCKPLDTMSIHCGTWVAFSIARVIFSAFERAVSRMFVSPRVGNLSSFKALEIAVNGWQMASSHHCAWTTALLLFSGTRPGTNGRSFVRFPRLQESKR